MPAKQDKNKALLVLENGQIFEGIPFGFSKPNIFGEVVFNTAMTG
ncbi:TPA: carbamoyl phosphate synthase small subunit, partial [archaeon]|nr:carbamoyl phosphate synthase small subunit [Candidatus Naiadarchaeales archaeon SRR2090159.bin1288]